MATLTPQQQQAVDAPADKHVVLEAVAGGGKTTVIGARIKKLIEYGIDPANIVVATFSKSQSEDMALRIFTKFPELKETPLATGFNGSGQILTLHALARRMIVAYYPEYAKKDLAPSYKERKFIEEIVESLGWRINDKNVGWESILWWINQFKGDANEDGDLYSFGRNVIEAWAATQDIRVSAHQFTNVAIEYQRAMDRANLWSFSDMLRVCEAQLTLDSDFRDEYRQQFTHILVDEGQDTNIQCMRILGKLDPKALFIVGDGDQELYGFLGARPEVNLRSGFDKRYGDNGIRLSMTANFRSQPHVLDRANKLIHNNYADPKDTFKKTLECGRGGEGPDLTWAWYDRAQDEASAVVGEIAQRIEEGDLKPGQVMIMGRLNAQNGPIEIELLRRKIPFVNLGNTSFFDQGVARIAIAHMQLVIDPSNWSAFSSIYNIASRNMRSKKGYSSTRWLGKEFLDKVRGSDDLIQATWDNRNTLNAKGWAQWEKGAEDLYRTLSYMQQYGPEENAGAFIADLTSLVLNAWIDDQYGVEADVASSVRDDLGVLASIASEFSIGQFLEYAEQLKNVKGVKPEDLVDYVLIGTVYRFKGLERDCVYIVGLSDGLLPHAFATGDSSPRTDGLPIPSTTTVASERNVAFVAVTRAAVECHCSGIAEWPTRKNTMKPSRFVYEMGITSVEADQDREDEEEALAQMFGEIEEQYDRQ